jgi:2-C-methyl-D-erythritol 4-phosphate cytidylyltransferase/2-C-methyl-D-erythritol 2,4-cyclodiphosphate synthase
MPQMHQKQPISIGIVVVAAGRGERAGASEEGPKQYRIIGGKPVIAHTLEIFGHGICRAHRRSDSP